MYNKVLPLLIVCVLFFANADLLAQEHENVDQVGRIYNYWHEAYDVVVVDDLAYIAAGVSGLQIMDVSDPENRNIIGYYDDNIDNAYGVTVSGDYAYIADNQRGLYIISVADPENPQEVGYLNTPGVANDVTVSGNYAYIADGGSGLSVVDISDPEDPELAGFVNTPGNTVHVAVADDYAYVVSGGEGLRIISIADPENPEEVSFYEGGALDVAISGDYAYLAQGSSDLGIVDISDPENPEEVGRCHMLGSAVTVKVSGGHAYVGGISTREQGYDNQYVGSGLNIISIRNPENPWVVGYFNVDCFGDAYRGVQSVFVSRDYAYLGLGAGDQWHYGGLIVVDIGGGYPSEAGNYFTPEYITDISVSGDYACVVKLYRGLGVVNITDPDNPEEIGYFECDAYEVAISGDHAYVAGPNEGLRIISIADPENPEEVGYFECDAYDVTISGDYAYITGGSLGLGILDISDPENPVAVGACDLRVNAKTVTVSDGYAYVAAGSDGLRIVNIRDPENPVEVGYYDTRGEAKSVAVSGNYAFVADGERGLRIILVTDPENPQEVGHYDTYDALGVKVFGNYAYIADGYRGLLVIDVTDPEHPEKVGYYDTPGEAWGVEISEDGLIYVADWTNVGIYRFTDPNKVDDPAVSTPAEFKLFPAYPNPFNSSTTISYGLALPAPTRLALYDMSGREVRTLFDGYRQAGFHSVNMNANDLSSGLYFVRLEGSGQIVTEKVMLIK